jgi:hypothetical protein
MVRPLIRRYLWTVLPIPMLAVGASLLVAAGPAGSSAGKSEFRNGGSLRVNLPVTDIDDIALRSLVYQPIYGYAYNAMALK